MKLSLLIPGGAILVTAGLALADPSQACREALGPALKTHRAELVARAQEVCGPLFEQADPVGLYAIGRLRLADIPDTGNDDGLELIQRAAEAGLADAQARLGRMYLQGEGVAPDPERAVGLFERAARQGHPMAQYELGQRYYAGEGIAKDPAAAYRWFALAVRSNRAAGDIPRTKLAERKKETLGKALPSGERRAADRWVDEWKPASDGD
jgi:hypothetical protein